MANKSALNVNYDFYADMAFKMICSLYYRHGGVRSMEKMKGKNKTRERLMKCTSVVGVQNFCWQLTADKREIHTDSYTHTHVGKAHAVDINCTAQLGGFPGYKKCCSNLLVPPLLLRVECFICKLVLESERTETERTRKWSPGCCCWLNWAHIKLLNQRALEAG